MAEVSKPQKKKSAGSKKKILKKKTAKKTTGKVSSNRSSKKTGKTTPGAHRRARGEQTLLIIAGEHSGDLLGAGIIHQLKKKGYHRFLGTGGTHMIDEGLEAVDTVDQMTVVGFVEAVFAYRRLKKLARQLIQRAVEEQVQTAILIDYPGFNLRFAKMLKEAGIRTIQVVAPQIWAWKYGRVKQIRKYIDLILPLFEFEKEIFDRENIPSRVIGHPLVSELTDRIAREKAFPKFEPYNIALLPGSRKSEIRRLLVPMLDAAEEIEKAYTNQVRFLLPGVNPSMDEFIRLELAKREGKLNIIYEPGRSLRMMKTSTLVVLASGTATLEAALLQKPMVILYRVGLLNFLIASIVVRTSHIGLVNILSENPPAIELLQSEVTAQNIFQEVQRIIEDNGYRKGIIKELKKVKESLGDGKPAINAADSIDRFIETNQGSQE